MRFTLPLLVAARITALPTQAGWPEIPKESWGIKSADLKGQPGALVLVDRYHFHRRQLERFRRVLVLSEAGKGAPELTLYGDRISKLQGRTVYPDLREQPFAQGQDVIKSTVVKTHRDSLQAMKVIPPGVTSHCIVDVQWIEPIQDSDGPVPVGNGWHYAFSFAASVPVQLAEVIVDQDVADFGWVRRYFPGEGQEEPETQQGKTTRKVFRNIPARPETVLASEAELALPACHWYWSPQAPIRDWLTELKFPKTRTISMVEAVTITVLYRWIMEGYSERPPKSSTLWEVGKGLDIQDPHQKAVALLKGLRERVKTIGELGERPSTKDLDRQGLESAVKRGWGTYSQLWRLAFHLFREHGIQTNVVMAVDRQDSLMGDINNTWQYDQILLCVDDGKGNLLYLNPGSTYQPVALPPWLQGAECLMAIPGKTRLDWTARILTLPSEKAQTNVERWKVTIRPGEEVDTYSGGVEVTGSRAAQWKSRIKDNASNDFKKSVAPIVEAKGFKVLQASGEGTADPWSPLKVTLEGSRENEGGRRRSLQPFPFLKVPFEVPATWPERRNVSIQFPMTTVIEGESRIPWTGEAPTMAELPALERANGLGRASWRAVMEEKGTERELVVRMRLEVSSVSAAAYRYQDLKNLTSWFQDALSRAVPAPASH